MPGANSATDRARALSTNCPFRGAIVAVESLVRLGGLAGSLQLLAGVATPPVSVLDYSPGGPAAGHVGALQQSRPRMGGEELRAGPPPRR
jgi:hypothetical protein